MTTISGINPSFFPHHASLQASDAAQRAEQLLNSRTATSAGGGAAPRVDTGANTLTGSSGAPPLSSDVVGALIDNQAQQTSGSSTPSSRSGSAAAGATTSSDSTSPAPPPGLIAVDPHDLASLPLPTPALLRSYSGQLTQSLNALLAQNGISQAPALSFSVDPNTAQVRVTGDRPDTAKIQSLINNDPSLKAQFHQVAATGSQLSEFQKGLKAVDAYLGATTPQQIAAVISQYYSGAPAQAANINLVYNGASIDVDDQAQQATASSAGAASGAGQDAPSTRTAAPYGSTPATYRPIAGR